ncbi:MAG: GIY-YIG nuclease family protein [Williamsia sp.]|nr:GIY-YIG nuclease family protein [Williamsia sp.]
MSYAIVDIETTGGHAGANGITEIAVILHNGREVEGQYQTLINPERPIPRYITALTGISNEMVQQAPSFQEVAAHIFSLLQHRIFVAHNVNFDYSFVKHHLQQHGYELNVKKLCTVRLSRKVFPGYLKYSLGSICRELDIQISARHRALGDAEATALLFSRIIEADKDGHLPIMLKGKNKEQYLPLHVPSEHLERLPSTPGVYYFHNQKGKVIYVGKAVDLQKRVRSHFSNNDNSRRKQEFIRNVCSITHQVCGSELMALILECSEIRRLWPEHNRSLKRFEHAYGLYSFEDQNGYLRLGIEKKRKHLQPLYTFNLLYEGQNLLRKLVREYGLSEALCFIDTTQGTVQEDPVTYNARVREAIAMLQKQLPTFAVQGTGKEDQERSILLIERGRFYGMGYVPHQYAIGNIDELKTRLTQYPDNDYIRGLIHQYAELYPDRKVVLLPS